MNEPVVAKFMFWDVVGDFPGLSLPSVPTLTKLKSHISSIVNQVACAMNSAFQGDRGDVFEFMRIIQDQMVLGINDEEFLNQALDHARKIAVKELAIDISNKKLGFMNLLLSAISTENLELVIQAYKLHPKLSNLTDKNVTEIMDTAGKYNNQTIIEFLKVNLVTEKFNEDTTILKNTFFKAYNKVLRDDKRAWCGIYGFFADSQVNTNMSLKELIAHAQKPTTFGNTRRSHDVMKDKSLNWLDDNGQLSDLISKYCI
ncbi:MAG: hypothetical protein H0U73_00265 [Tatlockia sp.]|nr:hypothetical protein [Tatlockia sp.]